MCWKRLTQAVILLAALSAVMLTPDFVLADIYKCVSKDGVATFSDQPCSEEAEIILDEEELNLDEAVGEASPFSDITIDSDTVDKIMLSHAKKIGKCILPDEQYNRYNVEGGERSSNRYPKWEITLYYGLPDKPSKWRIRIRYNTRFVDGVSRIWLTDIHVLMWNQYHNLPSMENTKKLKKIRAGQWQLVGWI